VEKARKAADKAAFYRWWKDNWDLYLSLMEPMLPSDSPWTKMGKANEAQRKMRAIYEERWRHFSWEPGDLDFLGNDE
jgi:hypothetical protein